MALSALIVSIISLIIGLLCFVFVGATALSIIKDTEYLRSSSDITQKKDDTSDFNDGFKSGQSVLFNSMQLAMFDMYQKFEILDYEEQFNVLMDRISKIVSNAEFRNELINTFDEYNKGKYNDMD